jgi:O-antigen/teichoic acid export membrane protein
VLIKKIKQLASGDDLQSKIAKGIAWSFLGTMISKIMMILVFVFIARILSVEEYGEIGILRNAILTFSMIAVASFGITATRYIAMYKDKDLEKTKKVLTITRTLVLILSLVLSLSIFIFSEKISIYILNNSELEEYVKYISVAIFFTSLNGYQNGALAGLERFKEISYINVINGFISFPVLLIGAYYWGVKGVIISLIITNFTLWLSSYYYLNIALKEANITLSFTNLKSELKMLYKFSLPTFISGLMLTPTFFILNSLLAHQENGYKQLGIFSAAFFFATLSRTMIQIIGQVLYPYAMKEFGKENKKFEFINNILPWFIGIIINLPLIIFPEIFSFIFGKEYQNEDFYLSLIFISFANIIIAHRQGISRNFAAANLMWWSVLSNMFWTIITLVTAYFIIQYGSKGIAISLFVGYIINSIVFIPFYVKKKLITKELLINKYVISVWLLTFMSMSFYYLISSLLLKLIFILSIFILISLLFLNYFRKTNDN